MSNSADSPQILQLEQTTPIKFYKESIEVGIYHFYICGEILSDPGPYLDMCQILKTAAPHDTIYVTLNSPGGDLYTAVQIISAIRASQADVITVIEGQASSAAAMIFISGDKHIVNEHSSMLIHHYSTTVGGKGHEVSARLVHTEDMMRLILTSGAHANFLTNTEVDKILLGQDLWLSQEQILKRLPIESIITPHQKSPEVLTKAIETAVCDSGESQLQLFKE